MQLFPFLPFPGTTLAIVYFQSKQKWAEFKKKKKQTYIYIYICMYVCKGKVQPLLLVLII